MESDIRVQVEMALIFGGIMLSVLGTVIVYIRLQLQKEAEKTHNRWTNVPEGVTPAFPPPPYTSDFSEWLSTRNEWQREIEKDYPPCSWKATGSVVSLEELKPLPRYKSPDRCPYCNRTKVGSDFCLGCGAPL